MTHTADIEGLLREMTEEEKAGQLNLLYGAVSADKDALRRGVVTGYLTGAPQWEKGEDFSWAEKLNELQRTAVEESRLHIPLLFSRDVIHGHRTVFPIPLGQAATFDPALVEQCAAAAADEASAEGVNWTYSPMVDISRDPRWGRAAEGYGEDPFLCSIMARAVVQGYQGTSLSAEGKFAACAKHFAGYGAGQGGRDYDSAELGESTLRQVYLPSFYAAVKAGVASIMPALQDLNGLPMCINKALLRGVLREEWGFTGLIVSDWGAIADLLQHRVAASEEEAVLLALDAGIEMDMVSGLYLKHLPRLVREGKASANAVDSAVRRVLELKDRLGLFENPYLSLRRERKAQLTVNKRKLARKAAGESIVLLKNQNNVLPLSADCGPIGVFGPLAEAKAELLGTWTLDGRREDAVSVLEGIRAAAAPGTRILCEAALPEAALAQAEEAKVIIVVLGEHPTRSGEAASVQDIELPPGQCRLLEQLAQFEIPIVAVIIAGRPLAIESVSRLADAVLYCFHPGIEGGPAAADIIFGKRSPSGKLPVTLPRSTGQIPVYYARRSTGRPARADARYTTKTIDAPVSPLFPFGCGLSYASFAYEELAVSPHELRRGDEMRISVRITNTSPHPGSEIVQLYVRDQVRSVAPPEWELKRFQKIELQPRESRDVLFSLKPEDLSFWMSGNRWLAEPGDFTLRVGPDSVHGLTSSFRLLEAVEHRLR